MKNSIIIYALLILSCSQKSIKTDYEVFINLIDENKYDEANTILSKKTISLREDERVIHSKECYENLNLCENTVTEFEIKRCANILKNSCDYQFKQKMLTSKLKEKVFLISLMNEKMINDINKKSICDDGMKWSYYKTIDKKIGFILAPREVPSEKYFESKLSCEEYRIVNDKSISNDCEYLYSRESLSVEYFQVKGISVSDSSTEVYNLKFKNLDTCEKSIKDGIEFYDENNDLLKFEKKNSNNKTKIVGECEKTREFVCSKGNKIENKINFIN